MAERLPTADSLCSLKVARASKISADGNFRRSLVGSLRACSSAELAAPKCIAAARTGSSSPRSIRSQRESAVGRRTTRRGPVPVGPKTAPHASAATIRSSVPTWSHRGMSAGTEKIARVSVLVLAEPLEARDSSPSRGKWGPAALASTRGPCGAGGRAFRGLTRSATEWSAARRKPIRAAAMPLGATISADVKARRLPTSQRRKLPSGNFRSARDFEGAERVNPRKARLPTQSVPVC